MTEILNIWPPRLEIVFFLVLFSVYEKTMFLIRVLYSSCHKPLQKLLKSSTFHIPKFSLLFIIIMVPKKFCLSRILVFSCHSYITVIIILSPESNEEKCLSLILISIYLVEIVMLLAAQWDFFPTIHLKLHSFLCFTFIFKLSL